MALDRQALVQQVLKGGQYPMAGFIPSFGAYRTTKGNGFDPAQARKLLAEAGYPGGKGFPRERIIYNTNPNHRRIAEWAQQQWKSVLGIDVEPVNLDWESLMTARQRTHDFAIARAGWSADFPDSMNYFGELLKTDGKQNDGLYSNPNVDALLDKANRMPLGSARDRVLMQAEELAIDQDQALLPLFHQANQDLIDLDKWGGWYENTLGVHPWKAIYRK
jgi:oligopeptide transport system substrate-binding protein